MPARKHRFCPLNNCGTLDSRAVILEQHVQLFTEMTKIAMEKCEMLPVSVTFHLSATLTGWMNAN